MGVREKKKCAGGKDEHKSGRVNIVWRELYLGIATIYNVWLVVWQAIFFPFISPSKLHCHSFVRK